MKFEYLFNSRIYGNHHQDSKLLKSLEEFILDNKNPMHERITLVKKHDEAIGYGREKGHLYTEDDVKQFVIDIQS